MKYTVENITQLTEQFSQLNQDIAEYVNRGYDPKSYSWTPARINYETNEIEHKVNTACNCHPEYNWETYSSLAEFVDWHKTKEKS